MYFDLETSEGRAARLMTALVTPRPIAWAVTQDREGRVNAAPFSFFNVMCSWPPVIALGVQPRGRAEIKDTRANIDALGEFVVNLVPFALAGAMNLTSAAYPRGYDEIAAAGLTTLPSLHVAPPRIAESPVGFECRLRTLVDLGDGCAVIIADVLGVHVDDAAVLDPERGKIDAARLQLIARMHGVGWYLKPTDLFEVARPPAP